MTNTDAILCEVKPYCSDGNSLELQKALLQANKRTGVKLKEDVDYDPDNEKTIALAAVLVLTKYLSLSSEHEGEWQQNYNDKLKERILVLCKSNDIDASEFFEQPAKITIKDGSKLF